MVAVAATGAGLLLARRRLVAIIVTVGVVAASLVDLSVPLTDHLPPVPPVASQFAGPLAHLEAHPDHFSVTVSGRFAGHAVVRKAGTGTLDYRSPGRCRRQRPPGSDARLAISDECGLCGPGQDIFLA